MVAKYTRSPRQITPAQALHKEVERRVGEIVLGVGADGGNITIAHLFRYSFGKPDAMDNATKAKIEALKSCKKEYAGLIRKLEKAAADQNLWGAQYPTLNPQLATQLRVYAQLMVHLCDGKMDAHDLAVIAKFQEQANAIGTIIHDAGKQQAAAKSSPGIG